MLLLQHKQDSGAVASTPPSPQVFITALPVFVLVCALFFLVMLCRSVLCFLAEKFHFCPGGDDDPHL